METEAIQSKICKNTRKIETVVIIAEVVNTITPLSN